MDFADRIAELAQRIIKIKDTIETEEATKNAFIMPFINALGYDVFDPNTVIPEFSSDVGIKKGEKVDYAIKFDNRICILIECKPCKSKLSGQHISQLYRYFSVTEAHFAILTNGIFYWFYSDLDEPNKMDAKPFFEFNMLDYRPAQVDELKKFAVTNFNMNSIQETASELKYSSLLQKEIMQEIDTQTHEFIRILISRVYDGKITSNIISKFEPLIQKTMKDTIRELVNQRLSSAIEDVTSSSSTTDEIVLDSAVEDDGIVTTQEEIDAYQIIRAITREVVKVDRIIMRDAKSYCAILLDDNNRKQICRFYFGKNKKCIGIFNADRSEEKFQISDIDDIFIYAEKLKEIASSYDKAKPSDDGNGAHHAEAAQ